MFEHGKSCTRTAAAGAASFFFFFVPDFIFIVHFIDVRLQEEMRVRLWTTSLKSTLGLYPPDG